MKQGIKAYLRFTDRVETELDDRSAHETEDAGKNADSMSASENADLQVVR